MADGGKDFERMEILLRTGSGYCWPKFTILIVDIKNSYGEVTWNKTYQTSKSHEHTEIQMLDDDEFQDAVVYNTDIILTSNYSPCRGCADKLKRFYEESNGSIRSFTIRFSQLYRIDEQANEDGLRYLNIAGITLEAMTKECWFDVLMAELFGLDPAQVRDRDDATRETLEKLLGNDSRESSDESESSNKSESSDSDVQGLFR